MILMKKFSIILFFIALVFSCKNVYAVEGTKFTLSVNVDKGTAKSYTWKKGTKTLENNTNTLEISEMSSEDVAKYTCTVSDDVTK